MDFRHLVGDEFFLPPAVYPHIHTELRPVFMMATVHRLARRRPGGLRVLEIGAWCGASMAVWAECLHRYVRPQNEDKRPHSSIVCVDPWGIYMTPSDLAKGGGYVQMDSALANGAARACFIHNANVAERKFGVSVMDFHGDSRKVLPMLQSGSFDLVYVDGSHYYEDVLSDLKEAKRLVRDGGIVAGDDLEHQLRDVDEEFTLSNLGDDTITDPNTGKTYHPGVCAAVGQTFGPVSTFPGCYWCLDCVGGVLKHIEFAEEELSDIFVPSSLPEADGAKFLSNVRQWRAKQSPDKSLPTDTVVSQPSSNAFRAILRKFSGSRT